MVTVATETRAASTGRKHQLIEATMTAIAQHGMSGLTLAKIADIVGMTAGSLNFHFSSKEALLLETLRHVSEEFAEVVHSRVAQAGEDPAEALNALVDASLDKSVTEARKVAVWYAFLAEANTRKDYLELCGDRDATYVRTVKALVKKLVDEEAADNLNGDAIAYGLIGSIDQIWQEILFDGDDYDRKAARKKCRAYLASVFPERFKMPGKSLAKTASSAAKESRVLAPVVDGGLTYTLPSWVYHSDEFFELEKEHIHLPAWQTVCHVSELPDPGSYVTFEMLDERAFVIRDEDGQIRAFHNVCAHRAHSVVRGPNGSCKGVLMCPYHGWTYNFDGSNRSVANEKLFPPFDRARFGLKPLDVEVFHGFVFIRFRSQGASVAERMAPFGDEFAKYQSENMAPLEDVWWKDYSVDWKNAVENYVEDYHFAIGHPGLSALMEPDYDREIEPGGVFRLSHRMRAQPRRNLSARLYRKYLPDYSHLPAGMRDRWTYFGLLPGAFFDVYPDSMNIFHVVPTGPGRMQLRGRVYGRPDNRRETQAVRYLGHRINRDVQHQDDALTFAVQGGLRSSGYDVGILSDKENVVKGFQAWVREKLPVTRLLKEPPAGTVAAHNREMVNK